MRKRRLRSLIPGARNTAPTQESQNAGMMTKLRQLLVGMAQMGSQSAEDRDVRNLVVGAARLARSPGKLKAAIEGMAETEKAQVAEASTWMTHEDIAAGKEGRFDGCDLRNWLAIAERAGVDARATPPAAAAAGARRARGGRCGRRPRAWRRGRGPRSRA